mmetsp:Transcript_5453/g.21567  ORF Transcript_5453/g.21567 Transcript_5453/m.21567 type:complete len:357 (-) Transcript_5453:25-1095(-)
MGGEVVRLDVLHVDRLLNLRDLVQLAAVVHDVGVLADGLAVGLEVHHVHFVEAHQRHEQADVRLGELVSRDVAVGGQDRFAAVERSEELREGRLVGALRLGEAAPVHAVVDARVDPLVDRVDRVAEPLRIDVEVRVLGHSAFVEGRVEHADDLRALVAHDGLGLLVPEHRHGVLAAGVVGQLVEITHGGSAVDAVGNHAGDLEFAEAENVRERRVVRRSEHPAGVLVRIRPGPLPGRVHNAEADDVLQALQVHGGQAPIRPRARIRDVQVVAIFLGRIGVGAGLDDIAVDGVYALEGTVLTALVESRARLVRRHESGLEAARQWSGAESGARAKSTGAASGDGQICKQSARTAHGS